MTVASILELGFCNLCLGLRKWSPVFCELLIFAFFLCFSKWVSAGSGVGFENWILVENWGF